MRFLHIAARGRGAKRVRLKVTNANERAVRLYERCGYRFEPLNETERVGFLEL
jgi:RimJ/RimL family protein N-acetyltransferase